MSRKRRILFVGEASFLATGFSTYWNEVIRRIHATGEFEVCELGSYANEDDPRCRSVPWRFVPVQPAQNDAAGWAALNSRVTNQFGENKFDELCLSFKPDVVAMIRDWWMDEFVLRSPLRKNFKVVWMPTVDGAPQRDPWMDSYAQCDKLLTYSQYGMDVLVNQSRGRIRPVTLASPGADLDVFSPVSDKRKHKQMSGIDPNAIIVGTVMRNQIRKLYYDLIEAYAQWYYDAMRKTYLRDRASKVYLYLHTSYPDVGYDVGKAIREFKVANRTLMTYICAACGSAYPAFFAGEWTSCAKCRQPSAHPPNASHSLDRKTLAAVINLFDIYVQYSICEGYGMPLTEAMACGVPCMAVNYSAMEDHVKMPGGIPIKVERMFYEGVMQTEQRRALPDNADFGRQLTWFLRLDDKERELLSRRTREYMVQPASVYGQAKKLPRFGYERTAAIWMNLIREMQIHDPASTWDFPQARLIQPNLNPPKMDMTNVEFVQWVIRDILRQPELAKSWMSYEWTRWLNTGFRIEQNGRVDVNRNTIVSMAMTMVQGFNEWEQRRAASLTSGSNDNVICRVM